MNWKTTICILFPLVVFNLTVLGQHTDADRLNNLFPSEKKTERTKTKINFENELQLVITGSFTFYKRFISPQDALHCSFYPSCSVYALQTIQTNGILGIFDAVDRLTRCNGFSPDKYDSHTDTHLFYDPVKEIH